MGWINKLTDKLQEFKKAAKEVASDACCDDEIKNKEKIEQVGLKEKENLEIAQQDSPGIEDKNNVDKQTPAVEGKNN